ncbi:MAG: GGDEF domain-containing protein [Spirochaetaceae bacterium]|jgi:diguanylate cyclase (GGDEF)-like protein|nr:GGDEF domain-containing protein [Spirochaetaceae bacterium]
MNIISVFGRWKYYNVTKEDIAGCHRGITHHNARSLVLITLASILVVLLFSLYPLVIQKSRHKFLIYMCFAAWELCAFLYAQWVWRRKKYRSIFVYPGVVIFFAGLMFFGIYIGIIDRQEFQAVNFLIFFICSQIMFIIDPRWNLLINFLTILVFSSLTIEVKSFSIWIADLINIIIAGITGAAFSWYMSYVSIREMLAAQRLESERNRFREESISDELTGIGNRRGFMDMVNFYISVCRHIHQTVVIIMLDVDYFKRYNDFYGHPRGDLVLQAIGTVLKKVMDEERVYAARVGGEEFIILGTENRQAEAERIALKIRQEIIDLKIPHKKSPIAPCVTVSLGVYFMRGGSGDTVEELYNQVDLALYNAKVRGRNNIVFFDSANKIMRPIELLPPDQNFGRR